MEKRKRKRKKKKRVSKKFYCTLCEKIVMKSSQVKKRKNYSHGKKSKATINYTHISDGGCLIELNKNE